MDNIFRQDKSEIELHYVYNVFNAKRTFESGISSEIDNVLFANSSKKIFSSIECLEREKLVRSAIKKVFNEYCEYDKIRLYYKYCREDVICKNQTDFREYEYFRIIYQSEKGELIFEEENIDNEKDIYRLLKIALNKVNLRVRTILDKNIRVNKLAGNFDIILPPSISGFYIHEIIGHLLEDDFFCHSATIINSNIKCSKILNVSDLAMINNRIYRYDDLGNKCRDILLIKNGAIIDYLSEKSGNKRRYDYTFHGLTRMRTTYIHPISNKNVNNFINSANNAILIEKVYSGNVNPIDGNYILIGYGVKIINGCITNFISNLHIEGNIIEDLMKIEDIGYDLKYQGIECLKKSQYVRVGVFSPSMLLKNIKVTGEMYE